MSNAIKTLKYYLSAFVFGLVGALFCLTDTGLFIEEEWGLNWLFQLRGVIDAPESVIIISIDQASAEIMHLSDDPEQWSRSYHAQLIEKINQQNPTLIALNIYFGEERSSGDDNLLAQSMAKYKNILLTNYLKQTAISSKGEVEGASFERVIDPASSFAKAAVASASFPLAKTSATIKRFWTCKRSVGDMPTLPAAAFEYYVFKTAYPEILSLLVQINPALKSELPNNLSELTEKYSFLEVFQKIQSNLTNQPEAAKQFKQLLAVASYTKAKKQVITAWLDFIIAGDSLYLNHYGMAGAVTTVPFYQALVIDVLNPKQFQDKIVMVGYSENIQPEYNLGFYNSFSSTKGVSPIEIAATAVANLVENSWIRPLPNVVQFFLILLWGMLLPLLFMYLPYSHALRWLLILNVLFGMVTYFQFRSAHVWVPFIIPLAQSVAVALWESINHLIRVRKVSERYLPGHLFDKGIQNLDAMHQFGGQFFGVCMATDAGQYTRLSEDMSPFELNILMNSYYSIMFPEVKKYNGVISDVIGDAMVAIWAKPTISQQVRIDACQAALSIQAAIQEFNQRQLRQLPTRIGLHFGEMRLGNVGAADHFEYRAIGDSINTANRIEDLNKVLGTELLVSAEVIAGLSLFTIRELGVFILRGKVKQVKVFELLPDNQPGQDQLLLAFSDALTLFKNKQWLAAQQAFQEILQNYPSDGPSLFYFKYITKFLMDTVNLQPQIDPEVIHIGKITT